MNEGKKINETILPREMANSRTGRVKLEDEPEIFYWVRMSKTFTN